MKLKVIYEKKHVDKPVLASVVLKTGTLVNILEAKMSPGGGEILVDVPKAEYVGKVIEAFKEEGVTVKELTKHFELDVSRCVACGACVSPCPVDAIKLTGQAIEVDEGKCVRCQACVHACPMRAIKLL